MKKILLFMAVAAICSGSVFAVNLQWIDNGSGIWNDAANWEDWDASAGEGGIPAGRLPNILPNDDQALVAGDITIASPAEAGHFQLGFGTTVFPPATMDIQSSLNINFASYIGLGGTGTADIYMNSASSSWTSPYIQLGHSALTTLDMSDGNLSAVGYILVGTNPGGETLMTMSGGTMFAEQFYLGYGTTGVLDLSGGTLTTNAFLPGAGLGTLNLSGTGKMVVNGGDLATIEGLFGTVIFNAQAIDVGGAVEITAIPEPATMMLLGLGGVLLRRKRA